MKKKWFVLLIVGISLIFLISIGLRLTGFVVQQQEITATRTIEKDETSNIKEITINIGSSENVVAVREFLSSNCNVLDYFTIPYIEISELKTNNTENIWILANKYSELNVKLYYHIPYDCNVQSGKLLILTEGNYCNGADINKDGKVDISDLTTFSGNYGKENCNENNSYCSNADINKDGKVHISDLTTLANNYERTDCGEEQIKSYSILTEESDCNKVDFNNDGKVDIQDQTKLAGQWYNTCNQENSWCDGVDIDKTGKVDIVELTLMAQYYGKTC